jgi:hypothetical protein
MGWLRKLFGMEKPKIVPCFPILRFIQKQDPEWWAANKHRPPSTVKEWPGWTKYRGRQYDDETYELVENRHGTQTQADQA